MNDYLSVLHIYSGRRETIYDMTLQKLYGFYYNILYHLVMGNPTSVTRASPMWHPQKLETCHSWATTQPENLYKSVDRIMYIISTNLQKDFILLCHFAIKKVCYVKLPCQNDALWMIWEFWLNKHNSAQGFWATYQWNFILKPVSAVTEPDFWIFFI